MVQHCYTSTICPPSTSAARLVGAVLGLDDLRGLLSGVALRLRAVDVVKALSLDDAVDEGTGEASAGQTVSTVLRASEGGHVQELLRLSVACGLAVGLDVLLVSLSSLWRRSSARPDKRAGDRDIPRRKQRQRSAHGRAPPCEGRC